MQPAQVIALLLPDTTAEVWTGPNSFLHGATALIRDAEGRMRLEEISQSQAREQQFAGTGRFKRGKPIVDPTSRQIVGYEMEMIA